MRGCARPRFANTRASSIAPMPVKTSARIEAGPASPASTAGSVKMPEPTMLPTTSAVAIQRPIERFSRGLPTSSCPFVVGVATAISPPFSRLCVGVADVGRPVLDRHATRLERPAARGSRARRACRRPSAGRRRRRREPNDSSRRSCRRNAAASSSGPAHLVSVHGHAGRRRPRPQLALQEVGDVELDHVLVAVVADVRAGGGRWPAPTAFMAAHTAAPLIGSGRPRRGRSGDRQTRSRHSPRRRAPDDEPRAVGIVPTVQGAAPVTRSMDTRWPRPSRRRMRAAQGRRRLRGTATAARPLSPGGD